MIIGFKDKETERIFYRGYSRRLPTQIQKNSIIKITYVTCLSLFGRFNDSTR